MEISKDQQPDFEDTIQTLLGTAAALRPTLVAPFSGLVGWLRVPDEFNELYRLVITIQEFAGYNIVLRPEVLSGFAGIERRTEALDSATKKAGDWLDDAPSWRPGMLRAVRVWQHLVTSNGPLRELLLPVSGNDRSMVSEVRQMAEQWQRSDYAAAQIDRIDQNLSGRKDHPIVGAIRRHLHREIFEACQLARRWCDLVEHEQQISRNGNWIFDQVSLLRDLVLNILPAVRTEIRGLGDFNDQSAFAAMRCLHYSLTQLERTLAPSRETLEFPIPNGRSTWCLVEDTDDLWMALGRRLLWVPTVELDDVCQPPSDEFASLALHIRTAYDHDRGKSQ